MSIRRIMSKGRDRSAGPRAGQIFSIDILFSLLPLMLILGASLQYLYLGEEQMKATARDGELEILAQSLSDSAITAMRESGEAYVSAADCDSLESALEGAAEEVLPSGYVYHALVTDYGDYEAGESVGGDLCTESDDLWSPQLEDGEPARGRFAHIYYNNPADSELRFVLQRDDSGEIIPGKLAGISITVWEDIP